MKPHILFILILCSLLSFHSCKEAPEQLDTFKGDPEAVELAERMFEAIGGKEGWCRLESVYIKAEHSEPQMTIPYQSEIWRSMTDFNLVIEQQNDSFHVKAVMNDTSGIINYLDERDTFRTLTNEQLKDWQFGNRHNVYVLLHDLACQPTDYKVDIEDDQLAFYIDTIFVTRFGLDEQLRPHLFYAPSPDGSISGSRFTRWGEDNGLIHSAGGHPLDSSFLYITEIWEPSNAPLYESFDP